MVDVMDILPVEFTVHKSGLATSVLQAASRPEDNNAPTAKISEQTSGARLTYDSETHRAFVEFIDPSTGDVIGRFPAEDMGQHLDKVNSLYGSSKLVPGSVLNSLA